MTATLQDYERALAGFLENLQRLGGNLSSVLVHGSMACGTIKPGWSDIMDAHVVLREAALEERESYLETLEVMLAACADLAGSGLPFHPFGYLTRSELGALQVSPFYTYPFEPYSRIVFGDDVLPEIAEGPASRELSRTYFFEAVHAVYFHLARYAGKETLTEVDRAQLVAVLLSVKKSLVMACAALGLGLTEIRKLDIVAQLAELVPGIDTSVIARIDGLREVMKALPEAERISRKSRGQVVAEGERQTDEIRAIGVETMRFLDALHGEIVRRGRVKPAAAKPKARAAGKRARAPEAARAVVHAMVLSLEYTPKLSGGMGTQVFELSRGLARAGHRVTVLAYAPGEPRVLERPNETVHLLSPDAAGGSGRPSIVGGILAFNRALVERGAALIAEAPRRPDVLHFHNWATYPAARELGERFGIPAIGTIHFVSEPIERWWGQTPDPEIVEQERRMFADAASLVGVSRSLRAIVRATHAMDGRPFVVVHNGLDPAPFTALAGRPEERGRLRRAVAADDEKIVLFAGRLNLQKGVSALLASAVRVLEQQPKTRYLVVGEPDSRGFGATVDGMLADLPGVRQRVTLLGKLPRRQLAALYQVADVAVVPSVYEPFGYAAIEAMAAGVPIVATRVGGLAEIVEDGETGFLIPVEKPPAEAHRVDVEALAERQLQLLGDDRMAKEMGRAAQARVRRRFSLGKMVESTAGAYRDALA